MEPADDVAAATPGERIRIKSSPWDGLDVRAEEVASLAHAAFFWQSSAGWGALDVFLRGGASPEAATATYPMLYAALSAQAD